MKTHRFIEEYAHFQIAQYKQDIKIFSDEPDRIKLCKNAIERIETTVRHTRSGLVTVNECMAIIANPLTYGRW